MEIKATAKSTAHATPHTRIFLLTMFSFWRVPIMKRRTNNAPLMSATVQNVDSVSTTRRLRRRRSPQKKPLGHDWHTLIRLADSAAPRMGPVWAQVQRSDSLPAMVRRETEVAGWER